jgi:hypothetical protein
MQITLTKYIDCLQEVVLNYFKYIGKIKNLKKKYVDNFAVIMTENWYICYF